MQETQDNENNTHLAWFAAQVVTMDLSILSLLNMRQLDDEDNIGHGVKTNFTLV